MIARNLADPKGYLILTIDRMALIITATSARPGTGDVDNNEVNNRDG